MGALPWLNAKHSKEHPPPSLADYKVLRPWALFRETTVTVSEEMRRYREIVMREERGNIHEGGRREMGEEGR